jgi:hypothetical protein
MPYIKQEKRDRLDPVIEALMIELRGLQLDDPMDSPEGNLNYVITRILDSMYTANYKEVNNACGVLTSCLLEYYRRVATPLENQKAFDNGDVYTNES